MKKNKLLLNQQQTKQVILSTIDKIFDAVSPTYGPVGLNVILENDQQEVTSTRDGVSVLCNIKLEDPAENALVKFIRQAAIKTNENAGDGTTTSTLLACLMVKRFFNIDKARADLAVQEMYELGKIVKQVIEENKVTNLSFDSDELKKVALLASGGRAEMAEFVVDCLSKVGREGTISLEDSDNSETTFHMSKGMDIPGTLVSLGFLKGVQNQTLKLNNPYILLADFRLKSHKFIRPVLAKCMDEERDLIVLAESVEDTALESLVINHTREKVKCAAIRVPGFERKRNEILTSISELCNAKVIYSERGQLDLEDLGSIEQAEVKQFNTVLMSDNFTNNVGKILVGGPTEIAQKDFRLRIEDALLATKNAVQYGAVKGGGQIQKKIVERLDLENLSHGSYIIHQAFEDLLKLLPDELEDPNVYDSVKTTMESFKNALSVATQLILTSNMIVNEDSKPLPYEPEF